MWGAVLGLSLGIVALVAVMLLWNYLITPVYQNVPREVVVGMLPTVFFPFNLAKGGMNMAATLLLYKPIVTALRKAGLVAPRFQGGDVDDFALWVNSQVVYPIRDRAERNSRTVIVEFTVLRDGSVADAHVIFGSDPVLNEQAVKAVMKSPKWTPAEQNGQTRSVRMNVPVVFDL